MDQSSGTAWLSSLTTPLLLAFGDELTLSRLGESVCWSFGGQSALVELQPNGRLIATFIDRESLDRVSNRPAAAAYRAPSAYGLNAPSCTRMIADMVDFFSGMREPKFVFTQAFLR